MIFLKLKFNGGFGCRMGIIIVGGYTKMTGMANDMFVR